MRKESKEIMNASIREFSLPKYEDIPNVGLYLEQVTNYINEYLAPLENLSITASMISNYVKKGLVANPIKKQYTREQIAYLLFIAAAKSVLSLDNISLFLDMQKATYTAAVAYEYFRMELENSLHYVFGLKEHLDRIGSERQTDEKLMLRNTSITIANKIYLEKCFSAVRKEKENGLSEVD